MLKTQSVTTLIHTHFNWLSFVLFFFGVSIYTSKSGISIFGLILLLYSIFNREARSTWINNKGVLLIASLYPAGALVSALVAIQDANAAVLTHFLTSWPWPLLALPAAALHRHKDRRQQLLAGLLIGLVISVGLALYIWATQHNYALDPKIRIISFWGIGYWGSFLAVSIVGLYVWITTDPKFFCPKYPQLLLNLFYVLTLLASLGALILVNTRGPWLATAFVVALASFWTPLGRRALILGVICLFAVGLTSEYIRQRAVSIFAVKVQDGRVTSSDDSNAGRLHMWKVALDFYKEQPWLGTGLENTEQKLRNFIAKQGENYRKLYTATEFSYRDQHSSYISMLVQMGVVFSLLLWGIILAGLIQIFRKIRADLRDANPTSLIVFSILMTHLIIFFFYSSMLSYEMATFFPLLGAMAARHKEISQ